MNSLHPTAYNWLVAAAVAVSLLAWLRLARRDARLPALYLGALAGAAVGAKLLYLLAEGWLDLGQPDLWTRWATGKSVLGALAGGYLGVEVTKRLLRFSQPTGDLFAGIVPLGIILGRVGCLLHGCCLGNECAGTAWWTLDDHQGHPRWPAVPLEIAFNAVALAAFFALRRRGMLPGQHFHLYLIGYGLFRFANEFGRATPKIFWGLSGYQLAALALAGFGVWRFVRRAARTGRGEGDPLARSRQGEPPGAAGADDRAARLN